MTNKGIHTVLSVLIGITFVAGLLFSLNSNAMSPKGKLPSQIHGNMTLKEAQELNKPIILNFFVDWCGACRRITPILNKVSEQTSDKLTYVYINSDLPENEQLVKEFNITAFPSLFYLDESKNKKVLLDFKCYFDENRLKNEVLKNLK